MADILAAIRGERIRQGLTYATASERIGLKAGNWCAIETGQRPASDDLLKRMAASLGLQLTLELRATIIRVDDTPQSAADTQSDEPIRKSSRPSKSSKRSTTTAATAKSTGRKRAAKSA